MTWVNGHIRVCHPREAWSGEERQVFVQTRLDQLKGPKGSRENADYDAAKHAFNMAASERVLSRCLSENVLDAIVDVFVADGLGARVVVPHPPFDDDDAELVISGTDTPRNALPFIYAGYLGKVLGCQVDEEIVQIARVGRTKLGKWARFLYQPNFGGAVRPGQSYILVDDVISTGGTFAALRSYILRNGGKVVFATVLANSLGKAQDFAISSLTFEALSQMCGPELDQFWTETFGHGIGCLTEAEGRFLREKLDEQRREGGSESRAELLQRLRDRIDEAAATCG